MLSVGKIIKLKNYPENGFGVIKEIGNGSIIVQFSPVNLKKYCLNSRQEVIFEDGTEGNLGQQISNASQSDMDFDFKLKLLELLNNGLFDQAKDYFKQFADNVGWPWYLQLQEQVDERFYKNKKSILALLVQYEFDKAEEYAQQNKNHVSWEWYENKKKLYHQKQAMTDRLRQYEFDAADRFARQNSDFDDWEWYENQKEHYLQQQTNERIEKTKDILFGLLERYEFCKAEEYALQNKADFSWKRYENIKIYYLQKQKDERERKFKAAVIALLQRYEYGKADKYAQQNKNFIQWEWYQTQIKKSRIKAVEQVWKTAGNIQHSTNPNQLKLSGNDQKLIRNWSQILPGFRNENYETEQMTSARMAELAALKLYSCLYGQAKDISILQITSFQDDRWKYADIESNGRWIDVKNARRAFSSPNSFSEHCVPRFKFDRTEQDVIISSFLSPYRKAGTENVNDDIIWLGETTWGTIENLQHHFNSPYLNVTFSTNIRSNFLPAWLFDYPDVCYANRDKYLAIIRSSGFVLPPECICGGALANKLVAGTYEEEAAILYHRITNCGLSRAVLFLHILDRFCRCMLNNKSFPNLALDRIIFPAFGNDKTPLGVFDPLETIRGLLDVLVGVSKKCTQIVKEFDMYRLSGPNILRGRTREGVWKTIFAYCGGWRSLENGTRVRCGQNPIFLGQDSHCPSCGYLVCHKCGFCSDRCRDSEERQSNWNT